jgi:hypothetical protein
MSKTVRARDLRDPRALPRELRRIAERLPVNETRDIIEHAADELEEAQRIIIENMTAAAETVSQ